MDLHLCTCDNLMAEFFEKYLTPLTESFLNGRVLRPAWPRSLQRFGKEKGMPVGRQILLTFCRHQVITCTHSPASARDDQLSGRAELREQKLLCKRGDFALFFPRDRLWSP